ncbi:bifunctional acetate--CoA ligase family protein/GNAT family N-acetyltransferase [Massilia agilis]|uniref:Bifunctional acetate--CoA ligase family protein/GNAT family N-acetyltransferase n=1 Tax=Massilia agilis TaxID=1811226 RepID=A0ABT2DA01_9BURK|nr:bifunctional acetate--CoA ligase family protein/GNAT family N-acetyltransferase [Massilia agilis]MCS0807664.1 bifunctional acetate--CoA ligase family protein/GNAT family N-acetyltransferase [Massilia agilis]
MSVRNLQYLFDPHSVAVIGASDRPHSVGATVFRNLLAGSFRGPVYAVNPRHRTVAGRQAYPDVAALPAAPELAVICTPAPTVPGIIAALAARGTRAAIIISAGLGAASGTPGVTWLQAALDAARPKLLRILGPNCIGLIVPAIGLNASFAHTNALSGRTAFVSQSGALVTGVLDWAKSRGIGFSRFISLGEGADVDFGDVLDYLAGDPLTQSILLYIEDVRHARKFMSAARAAGRSKPTVVLKAGRVAEGARAAASHSGALAGSDAVYETAFRRAGMLRVMSTEELFDATETLAHARRGHGERLAILTNGGGPGVMATDELICGGGTLATLSTDTLARLDALLPPSWPRANPIDIIGDAPPERYRDALQVVLEAPEVDAVLMIHCPTAIVSSAEIARAVVPLTRNTSKNVFGCWLGGDALADARRMWASARLPAYDTPEDAIDAFLQIVRYRHNQQLLMQVPPAAPAGQQPEPGVARALVRAALASGRQMLTEPESKALLAAYGIPVVDTRSVETVAGAVEAAHAIGFPVALKILSPDVTHKTDVGGVELDLPDAAAVQAAAHAMAGRLAHFKPGARLLGYTVQAMARRPDALELLAGTATDPVFGPVIVFGQGGIAVDITADRALALPPLDMVLAHDLLRRTRVSRLLGGYRNRPAVDTEAVSAVLIRLSHLVTDIPEVLELDINPLLADHNGVIALDARVRVAPAPPGAEPYSRLAIRPYPQELERTVTWQGQPLTIRPVRPEDAPAHVAFFNRLTPEDVRLRMFVRLRELSPAQLARFTQIDYDREMAFIATRVGPDGEPETLGVSRAVADPDNVKAEFAVTIRSDLKGQGLGTLLMQVLVDYCRDKGIRELVGEALAENVAILRLAARLGFHKTQLPGEEIVSMCLNLQGPGVARPAVPA